MMLIMMSSAALHFADPSLGGAVPASALLCDQQVCWIWLLVTFRSPGHHRDICCSQLGWRAAV